jgi:hypothetical protein
MSRADRTAAIRVLESGGREIRLDVTPLDITLAELERSNLAP